MWYFCAESMTLWGNYDHATFCSEMGLGHAVATDLLAQVCVVALAANPSMDML